MTDPVLQEKNDLIEAQSSEIYHLRRAIDRALDILRDAQAGYMAPAGWVKQNEDGSVVLIFDQ